MIKFTLIYLGIGLVVDIIEVIVANSALYRNPITEYGKVFEWFKQELGEFSMLERIWIIVCAFIAGIIGLCFWPITECILIFKCHCVVYLD